MLRLPLFRHAFKYPLDGKPRHHDHPDDPEPVVELVIAIAGERDANKQGHPGGEFNKP